MNEGRLWVIRLGKLKEFTEEVIREHVEHSISVTSLALSEPEQPKHANTARACSSP